MEGKITDKEFLAELMALIQTKKILKSFLYTLTLAKQ